MKPAESIRLWQRIAEGYRRRLHESPASAECLRVLELNEPLVLEHFQAGYSDGTLSSLLPKAGELPKALCAGGLLNHDGQETLEGCLVVPLFRGDGSMDGFCGVRPSANAQPEQIVVPASVHGLVRGVLARDGSPLLVTDKVLDAFALWQAGFTNVVVFPAGSGSLPELERLIAEGGFDQIYLCPGGGHLETLRQALADHRACSATLLSWPDGVIGAREFFRSHRQQEFEALLRETAHPQKAVEQVAGLSVLETPEGLEACLEGRRYELRAIQKPGPGRLRATVRLLGEQGRFVVETIDFYQARSRRGFLSEAARLLHQSLEVLEGDLNRLTDQLEQYLQKRITENTPQSGVVTEGERAEGTRLGQSRDLVGEIVRDMGELGMIGEETNPSALNSAALTTPPKNEI